MTRIKENQIKPIIKVVVGGMLSLVLFSIPGGLVNPPFNLPFLLRGVFISMGLLIFAVCLLMTTRRGYAYFLLFSIAPTIASYIFWDTAYLISQKEITFVMGFGSISMIVGMAIYFIDQRRRLKRARNINIKTGKHIPEKGIWDLEIKLHLDDPEMEKKQMYLYRKLGRWIAPLGPPIGYLLARSFSGQGLVDMFSALFLILSSLIGWGGLTYLAIMFELLDLEKKHGKKILIPS